MNQHINNRRTFLKTSALLSSSLLLPQLTQAGTQKEEALADNVATAMRQSIDNASPPYLVFSKQEYADKWLQDMSERLKRYTTSESERKKILINMHYESVRAGLDPQLVLGLIQVESAFRRYAVSGAGARGLMQVMPFWVRAIGTAGHNLFDTRTNLRYGCTILRHYLNMEKGDLYRALGRYNGSTGQPQYPNAVFGAYRSRWIYEGPL